MKTQLPVYLLCGTMLVTGFPHYKTASGDDVVVYAAEPDHPPHGNDESPEWPSRARGPTAITSASFTASASTFDWPK